GSAGGLPPTSALSQRGEWRPAILVYVASVRCQVNGASEFAAVDTALDPIPGNNILNQRWPRLGLPGLRAPRSTCQSERRPLLFGVSGPSAKACPPWRESVGAAAGTAPVRTAVASLTP